MKMGLVLGSLVTVRFQVATAKPDIMDLVQTSI